MCTGLSGLLFELSLRLSLRLCIPLGRFGLSTPTLRSVHVDLDDLHLGLLQLGLVPPPTRPASSVQTTCSLIISCLRGWWRPG